MATKKELELELIKTKEELEGTKEQLEERKTEAEEYEKTRIKQLHRINELETSENGKDQEIKQQSNNLVTRNERITILQTQRDEMQKRLDKSWDKETAQEAIKACLENLPRR